MPTHDESHSANDVAARVARLEQAPTLPVGTDERFVGYGVMAAPFESGHLLAMRRFVATSVGPAYTSIWHRTPDGAWTFYADAPPLLCCPRYFGAALKCFVNTPIELRWPAPNRLELEIPSVPLRWTIDLETTFSTRVMNAMSRMMPDRLWRSPAVLALMSGIAGPLLGAGRLQLAGQVPNGQWFVANPMQIWSVRETSATIGGEDLGRPGPLSEQTRLGDFIIPATGLFAIGRAFFETADETRHKLIAQIASS
jgi:hypothetical protein